MTSDQLDMSKYIDIVFDAPPGHESGRFVEVENEQGQSIQVGEWINPASSEDTLWRLRIHTERGINSVAKEMHRIATASGFHEGEAIKTPLEEVCLWMTECAEAAEEARAPGQPLDRVYYKYTLKGDPSQYPEDALEIFSKIQEIQRAIEHWGPDAKTDHLWPTQAEQERLIEVGIAKPEGFGIEAADAVIRIMDSLVEHGIDLAEMIRLKSMYNRTRERLHGKTK